MLQLNPDPFEPQRNEESSLNCFKQSPKRIECPNVLLFSRDLVLWELKRTRWTYEEVQILLQVSV